MALRHLNQIDLADRWNISHRTLERWRWTGEGPCFVKLGGRVVYRLEDIEAFECEQVRSSTSKKPVLKSTEKARVMNRPDPMSRSLRRGGFSHSDETARPTRIER